MLPAVATHAMSQAFPCAMGALASSSRLLGVVGNSLAAGSATERSRIHAGTGHPLRLLGRHMTTTSQGPGAGNRDDTSLPPPTKLQQGGSFAAGVVAPHPGIKSNIPATPGAELQESFMSHPAYDWEYLEGVRPTHTRPEKLYQHVGLTAIRIMRRAFDVVTGYGPNMTEAKWLQRMIFLETVAGVPGMVAGMLRHLKSLRTMQRDHGWIHTLLEEAENERMHLITFFELRKPGPLFRAAVIVAQGVFFNLYFLSYLLSPRTCHAFVGFLEEEAVKTYTRALEEIDAGRLWKDRPAPPIAMQYWGLKEGATMRDLILAVRADEACHAHVNHTLSKLKPNDANPFATGASQLP